METGQDRPSTRGTPGHLQWRLGRTDPVPEGHPVTYSGDWAAQTQYPRDTRSPTVETGQDRPSTRGTPGHLQWRLGRLHPVPEGHPVTYNVDCAGYTQYPRDTRSPTVETGQVYTQHPRDTRSPRVETGQDRPSTRGTPGHLEWRLGRTDPVPEGHPVTYSGDWAGYTQYLRDTRAPTVETGQVTPSTLGTPGHLQWRLGRLHPVP